MQFGRKIVVSKHSGSSAAARRGLCYPQMTAATKPWLSLVVRSLSEELVFGDAQQHSHTQVHI